METLPRSESRRLYSWWWDSHNSPNNSKWLQDNLTDMDAKVKSMIKLIEEDADSFARRAEMYYKKRPELMKLVEEFYRAYRALAERYNHATGELRHAHRTIAKAFPDQVPLQLVDDSASKPFPWGPHTLEMKCRARVLFDSDDEGESKTGSKISHNDETQCLEKALADMVVEKEEMFLEYQNCLEKLSNVERELEIAKKDSITLNEKATKAEIEVETLKEALVHLYAEKNVGLEKISNLESMLSRVQEDMKSGNQSLSDEISRLKLEKERIFLQNKECLEKTSLLDNIVSVMENEAKLLKIQAEESENEISELKKSLADLSKEKEKSGLEYKRCLETISKLEKDIANAKKDVNRLSNDVLMGNLKLKASEMSNLSLRAEANNLAKKIAVKDRELSDKQDELENLQKNLQDEHFRYTQIEATLETLRDVHSHSQDGQGALMVELKNALQMLNELEVSKNGLEEEIKQVRDEHQISMENIQNEMVSLREIKEKLEKEVLRYVGLSNLMEQEILHLKEEIKGLNESYRSLVEQVERAGLNPKCLGHSIKILHDENAKMKQKCEDESNDRMILLKKLENVEDVLAEKTKALQESWEFLNGEKGALIAEKAFLMSQLQVLTENMHNLLGKNAVLENCLSNAKVELEGLREKSKGLEDICELLKDERSYLLNEKSSLVCKLENVEQKLKSLEKKFNGLEEKYTDLENEKKGVDCKVEELKGFLSVEKHERKSSEIKNESILAGLENQIHILKEENRCKKKEYDEELDKALKAQFEISILQKFMKDMEEKNHSLIIECQKHVEASKLADKLISELESESLEQQVESEFLLDEIERLRLGIYRVFRALDSDCDPVDKIENEGNFVNHIVESIEDMKSSISKTENDKEMLLVENSVLLTLLEQLESKGVEIESQKMNLERDFKIVAEKLDLAKNEMKQILLQTEGKLLQTESKLEAAENVRENLEKNIFELSENNSIQKKEIEGLCKVNMNLESEIGLLREEKSTNELKLETMNNEFELFEAEATAFYFDLQISSSIHEVLYEHKLQDVTSVCRNLENKNVAKTLEIEQMKGKICSMEREINGLKSQLHAYAPVVASIRDDLTFLEQNAVLQAKRKVGRNHEAELLEVATDPRTSSFEILQDDQSLISLQNLHMRIKAVGKMMEQANKPVSRRTSNIKSKQESIIGEIDKLKARRFLGLENNKKKAHSNEDTPKLQKIKTKVWNGMRMKDIPLDHVSKCIKKDDQMLEICEIGEDGKRIQTTRESPRMSCKMTKKDIVFDDFENTKPNSSAPSTDSDMERELGVDMLEVSTRISKANKEVSKRRVLERLTSDAQKLENLQTTVETLKTNLETNKTSKKGKNVDFETVQEQLVEAEETVVHLVDMNGELVRKLQECPSPDGRVSPRRRKVVEQARKGSERIGRLQLELQKLEFIVMKMEDDKKNKGKIKFFRNKSVVLRDFIYNGKRNSVKRKKGPLCGCFRPSTSRNGRSL